MAFAPSPTPVLGRKPTNGNGRANGNGCQATSRHPVDLLAAYQKRYTALKDALPPDAKDTLEQPSPPPEHGNTGSGVDKSVLAIGAPKRIRAPDHLKRVAALPCLICNRQPSDAHHLKRVQPNALGRKPGDQWVVPLCRIHHRALHDAGDETRWWQKQNINAEEIAQELWDDKYDE
jgi:hypothetical protein